MAATSNIRLEIEEVDEANKVIAKFVQSESNQGNFRVDQIPKYDFKSWWETWILDVFLPAGYPNSVTEDYTEYQIYAFASSIVGLIASRAVLASVGVGDATASAMAAVAYNVLEQMAGRLATIAFAHRFGTSLEPECKMYRLLADVLNDIGFVLDCLSPMFPKPIRVIILSFSGVLRALCGVAAGSSKASLSSHFARQGNLGELNAKDSSQETVISLAGMIFGVIVVPYINGLFWTWSAVIMLLSIHLEMNRRAVRAVKMRTLNRQRATLVYHHLRSDSVPTPAEISGQERIFERSGALRNIHGKVSAYCELGVPFQTLPRVLGRSQNAKLSSATLDNDVFSRIFGVFESRQYILWYTARSSKPQFFAMFKIGATTQDTLLAWWHALTLIGICENDQEISEQLRANGDRSSHSSLEHILSLFQKSGVMAEQLLEANASKLEDAGWDLNTSALETRAKLRINTCAR